ncbi:DUF2497 domain-containing protein [Roseomonas sp. M0104]|uniref:DUF2497 domain-containing protein n=1 Tax=Teichococcus coralli TaxID=2545983 RepID=A0A845BCG5_9PROT|nr:DUF2497 domain-containing protein [Pseudoroseomonas coralli]MXP63830.1 DUF2497 domain-containing protein [Pseudoroseomonas coralli]
MAGSPSGSPDPSMEEILASIRQILNEDELQGARNPPLELTEDMLVRPALPAPGPETSPSSPEPQAASKPDEAPASQARAMLAALEGLAQAVARDPQAGLRRSGGPSIEDVVREELRPLLKAWLDEHLPAIVEQHVKAEIARVTGQNPG